MFKQFRADSGAEEELPWPPYRLEIVRSIGEETYLCGLYCPRAPFVVEDGDHLSDIRDIPCFGR
jgi:hypothetical protein